MSDDTFKRIGTQMLDLTGSYLDSEDDGLALGKTIDGFVRAAVKAVIPGRQSAKNIRECHEKARAAFARALARKAPASDEVG